MKTTSGKTKAPRPSARAIQIINSKSGRLLAVRKAASLRQALLEYHKETLAKRGDHHPKVVGNVLTTTTADGEQVLYTALETYQAPTRI